MDRCKVNGKKLTQYLGFEFYLFKFSMHKELVTKEETM